MHRFNGATFSSIAEHLEHTNRAKRDMIHDPIRAFIHTQRSYSENLEGMVSGEYIAGQHAVLDEIEGIKDSFDQEAFEWGYEFHPGLKELGQSNFIEVLIKVTGYWSSSQITVKIDLDANESRITHSSGGRESGAIPDDRDAAMNFGAAMQFAASLSHMNFDAYREYADGSEIHQDEWDTIPESASDDFRVIYKYEKTFQD